jgi:hypothetical protein
MTRLDELIKNGYHLNNDRATPEDVEYVFPKYYNVVFDDRDKFEKASYDSLRKHFREWSHGQPGYAGDRLESAKWNAFIVIDEETMTKILELPTTDFADEDETHQYYLSVVDAKFGLETPEDDSDDCGWYSDEGPEMSRDEIERQNLNSNVPGFSEVLGQALMVENSLAPQLDGIGLRNTTWAGHLHVSLYPIYLCWHELSLDGASLEK